MRDSSVDLVVFGAGPAGLAAAWRAARGGRSVLVLERASQVGGLAGSFEVAGVRVDFGSHRLHPATPPAVRADLDALLGADLQTRPRRGRLRLAGTWVGFPLRAGELARTLPVAMPAGTLARMAAESCVAPLRRPRADTYADVLRSGLGPTLYETLYAPYAQKLWGLPGERISGEQARRRVTADTPYKIAGRMLRPRRGSGQGRVFSYPRRGYGQIAEALAGAATDAGARVRTGATVEEVDLTGDTVRVRVAGGERIEAGHVFSTIPLTALAAITRPQPPDAATRAAGALRFRAMVLVYLVHDGGRYTPYDAHYIPGGDTPVARVSEPANYRDSADDPADRSVLCCEIPCAVGDGVWQADDAALGQLAGQALRSVGLPPVRLAGVTVRRLPRVYPVYELGYESALEGLDSWAGSLPGLTTLGRLGLFTHDNSHHAMVMAYDAVDALGPGGFDRAAWREARARFARHVVED